MIKSLSTEIRAAIFVALSAILYGCLGSLGIKILDQHLSVPSMLFWRFLVATVWMLGWAVMSGNKSILQVFKQYKLMLILGLLVIFYSVASALYFLVSEQLGTGLAMVLFFTFPIFVVILSWLIEGHRITKLMLLTLVTICIGLVLLNSGSTIHLSKSGIIYAFIAALFFGAYVFGSKYVVNKITSANLTIFVCLGCAVLFFCIAHIDHSFAYPESVKTWVYVCAIGIFATALPVQLLLEGIRFIHPSKAAILSVLEPVVTVILGIVVLHETTSTLQMVGALIILASALAIQFER